VLRQLCGEVVYSVFPCFWGKVLYALFTWNSAALLSFNDFCSIHHPPLTLFYSFTSKVKEEVSVM
jgi:hypothetical protein